MKRNVNFFRRKLRKLKLTSSTAQKLYKKFNKSISPAGRSKFNEILKSLNEIPELKPDNFHQTLDKEVKKKFPLLKLEEFDVAKFIALNQYIEELEEKLASVGDDSQLGNIDLQNVLQKQQQTLQLLSNVSKMLHDTTIGIIRKIG